MPLTIAPPTSAVNAARRGLDVHARFPLPESVSGVSVAQALVDGDITPSLIARIHRFFTASALPYLQETRAGRTEETSVIVRAWLMHGAETGRAWAEKHYRRLVDEGTINPDPYAELFVLSPDDLYDAFSAGAWRYEYGLSTSREAARFVEHYARATGNPVDLGRAFGESADSVGRALYRRLHAPDPWSIAAAALKVNDPGFQDAAGRDLDECAAFGQMGPPLDESLKPSVFKVITAIAASKIVWPVLTAYFILLAKDKELLKPTFEGKKIPPNSQQAPLTSYPQYSDLANIINTYFHSDGHRYVPPSGDYEGIDSQMLLISLKAHMGTITMPEGTLRAALVSARDWLASIKYAGPGFLSLIQHWKAGDYQSIAKFLPVDADITPIFNQWIGSGNAKPDGSVELTQTPPAGAEAQIASYLIDLFGESGSPFPLKDTSFGKACAEKGTPVGIGSLIDRKMIGKQTVEGAFFIEKQQDWSIVVKEASGEYAAYADAFFAKEVKEGNLIVVQAHADLPGTSYVKPVPPAPASSTSIGEKTSAASYAYSQLGAGTDVIAFDKTAAFNAFKTAFNGTLASGTKLTSSSETVITVILAVKDAEDDILFVLKDPDGEFTLIADGDLAELFTDKDAYPVGWTPPAQAGKKSKFSSADDYAAHAHAHDWEDMTEHPLSHTDSAGAAKAKGVTPFDSSTVMVSAGNEFKPLKAYLRPGKDVLIVYADNDGKYNDIEDKKLAKAIQSGKVTFKGVTVSQTPPSANVEVEDALDYAFGSDAKAYVESILKGAKKTVLRQTSYVEAGYPKVGDVVDFGTVHDVVGATVVAYVRFASGHSTYVLLVYRKGIEEAELTDFDWVTIKSKTTGGAWTTDMHPSEFKPHKKAARQSLDYALTDDAKKYFAGMGSGAAPGHFKKEFVPQAEYTAQGYPNVGDWVAVGGQAVKVLAYIHTAVPHPPGQADYYGFLCKPPMGSVTHAFFKGHLVDKSPANFPAVPDPTAQVSASAPPTSAPAANPVPVTFPEFKPGDVIKDKTDHYYLVLGESLTKSGYTVCQGLELANVVAVVQSVSAEQFKTSQVTLAETSPPFAAAKKYLTFAYYKKTQDLPNDPTEGQQATIDGTTYTFLFSVEHTTTGNFHPVVAYLDQYEGVHFWQYRVLGDEHLNSFLTAGQPGTAKTAPYEPPADPAVSHPGMEPGESSPYGYKPLLDLEAAAVKDDVIIAIAPPWAAGTYPVGSRWKENSTGKLATLAGFVKAAVTSNPVAALVYDGDTTENYVAALDSTIQKDWTQVFVNATLIDPEVSVVLGKGKKSPVFTHGDLAFSHPSELHPSLPAPVKGPVFALKTGQHLYAGMVCVMPPGAVFGGDPDAVNKDPMILLYRPIAEPLKRRLPKGPVMTSTLPAEQYAVVFCAGTTGISPKPVAHLIVSGSCTYYIGYPLSGDVNSKASTYADAVEWIAVKPHYKIDNWFKELSTGDRAAVSEAVVWWNKNGMPHTVPVDSPDGANVPSIPSVSVKPGPALTTVNGSGSVGTSEVDYPFPPEMQEKFKTFATKHWPSESVYAIKQALFVVKGYPPVGTEFTHDSTKGTVVGYCSVKPGTSASEIQLVFAYSDQSLDSYMLKQGEGTTFNVNPPKNFKWESGKAKLSDEESTTVAGSGMLATSTVDYYLTSSSIGALKEKLPTWHVSGTVVTLSKQADLVAMGYPPVGTLGVAVEGYDSFLIQGYYTFAEKGLEPGVAMWVGQLGSPHEAIWLKYSGHNPDWVVKPDMMNWSDKGDTVSTSAPTPASGVWHDFVKTSEWPVSQKALELVQKAAGEVWDALDKVSGKKTILSATSDHEPPKSGEVFVYNNQKYTCLGYAVANADYGYPLMIGTDQFGDYATWFGHAEIEKCDFDVLATNASEPPNPWFTHPSEYVTKVMAGVAVSGDVPAMHSQYVVTHWFKDAGVPNALTATPALFPTIAKGFVGGPGGLSGVEHAALLQALEHLASLSGHAAPPPPAPAAPGGISDTVSPFEQLPHVAPFPVTAAAAQMLKKLWINGPSFTNWEFKTESPGGPSASQTVLYESKQYTVAGYVRPKSSKKHPLYGKLPFVVMYSTTGDPLVLVTTAVDLDKMVVVEPDDYADPLPYSYPVATMYPKTLQTQLKMAGIDLPLATVKENKEQLKKLFLSGKSKGQHLALIQWAKDLAAPMTTPAGATPGKGSLSGPTGHAPVVTSAAESPYSSTYKQHVKNLDPTQFTDFKDYNPGEGSNKFSKAKGPNGTTWFIKHPKDGNPSRAEGEAAAWRLMETIGGTNALPVGSMSYGGTKVSVQPFAPQDAKVPIPPDTMTPEEKAVVLRQHAIDMFIGDHDAYAANWIKLKGKMVPVDRAQAFQFYATNQMQKMTLDPSVSITPNKGYAKELLVKWGQDKATIPPSAFMSMRSAIDAIQNLTDQQIKNVLTPYLQNATLLDGHTPIPIDQYDKILKRIYTFRDKYLTSWTATLKKLRPDFEWPTEKLPPIPIKFSPAEFGFNEQHAKDVQDAVAAGWQGKSLSIDGPDVENQEVMVAQVDYKAVTPGGPTKATLVHFRLSLDGTKKVAAHMNKTANIVNVSASKYSGPGALPIDTFWPVIYSAVKHVNHHMAKNPNQADWVPDGKLNPAKIDALKATVTELTKIAAATEGQGKYASLPNGVVNQMAKTYLQIASVIFASVEQIAEITAANKNKPLSDQQKTETFSQFVWTPPTEDADAAEEAKKEITSWLSVPVLTHGQAKVPSVQGQPNPGGVATLKVVEQTSAKQPDQIMFQAASSPQYKIEIPSIPHARMYVTAQTGQQAYQGQAWGVIPGEATSAQVAVLMKAFTDAFGGEVQMKPADGLDREILYLSKQAFLLQPTSSNKFQPSATGEGVVDPPYVAALSLYKNGEREEARKALREYVASRLSEVGVGGKKVKVSPDDLDVLPGYNEQVYNETELPGGTRPVGFRRQLRLGWTRKSLADYMQSDGTRTGSVFVAHHIYSGKVSDFLAAAVPVNGALLSSVAKPYYGVPVSESHGGSPTADVQRGGAAQIFGGFRRGANNSSHLYFDLSIALRDDVYVIGSGDSFGDPTVERYLTPEAWKGAGLHKKTGALTTSSTYQVVIRHDADLRQYLAYGVCDNATDRNKAIAVVKQYWGEDVRFGPDKKKPEDVFVI